MEIKEEKVDDKTEIARDSSQPHPICSFEADLAPTLYHSGQQSTRMTNPKQCPPPSFSTLNISCLEDIFEWLSICELRPLRQTCKRFRWAVDTFIQLYCPGDSTAKILHINRQNISEFRNMDSHSRQLCKTENFSYDKLGADQVKSIQSFLTEVEVVLLQSNFDINLDELLIFCKNMKFLFVDEWLTESSSKEWTMRHYPALQYLQFGMDSTVDLKAFLERNPNIRTFVAPSEYLLANGPNLIGSRVKLDQLVVNYLNSFGICDLLNKLHDEGVYKRLRVQNHIKEEQKMSELTKLRALDSLHLGLITICVALPPLDNLKELIFGKIHSNYDVEKTAKNLRNLERLRFSRATFNFIIPFLRHSTKIRHIAIKRIARGDLITNDIIDLEALNKEREKLKGGRKVAIYVDEKMFLATKWAIPTIDLQFVQLKRIQAIKWEEYYNFWSE